MSRRFFFLHGFLGRPSDWQVVQSQIAQSSTAIDLFGDDQWSPQIPIRHWGGKFNAALLKSRGMELSEQNILVGYSMGGRLALGAFFADNSFWNKLILISSNPGMELSEKSERKKMDSQWALRFSNEDWKSLIEAWNAQSVFRESANEPLRLEADFRREDLARALTNWSLSEQEDFRGRMDRQEILLVCGSLDQKYQKIAENLKSKCPSLSVKIVKESGHRILFDQPFELAKIISEFTTH